MNEQLKIYMRFLRRQQKTLLDKRALRRMPAKVTHIEVKPGNLGTKHGWSIPVNVRIVPVKHIEVKYLP